MKDALGQSGETSGETIRWLYHLTSAHVRVAENILDATVGGFPHRSFILPAQIEEDGPRLLMLGAAPSEYTYFKHNAHADHIYNRDFKEKLRLVVRVLEELERPGAAPGIVYAQPEDWPSSVDVVTIDSPDGRANFDFQSIFDVVNKIHDLIDKNLGVYVHCRQGKGRSTALVLCYLCTAHQDWNHIKDMTDKQIDDLIQAKFNFVKERRSRIDPSPEQLEFVQSFINYYRNEIKRQLESEVSSVPPRHPLKIK